MNNYNHIDLFSGIGGFAFGLNKNQIKTVQFVECENYLQRVLNKNWPQVPIHSDIRNYHAPLNPFVITGGFPCQDISIGNPNGKGLEGERSGLWYEFKRIIYESKPKYAIIENVFTLLSKGLGSILQDLAEIGYDATYTTIDSKFTGVPQRRRRVYILAVRDGIPDGADPLENSKRSGEELREKIRVIKEEFRGDFAEGAGIGEPIAYFTRQRSDQFVESGIASTITKRDWKSYTDIVLHSDGKLRRTGIKERLRLQGFPDDWFNNCGLTNIEKYKANGMTVNVTKWLGEKLIEFDSVYGVK